MSQSFDNNTPIYIQLVEIITVDIISGQYPSGERLPSVRDFAFQHKVNPNTVQKAFAELENNGLIFTERTNGKFVTEDVTLIEKHKKAFANMLTQKYIKSMKNIGLGDKDILLQIKNSGGVR